MRGGRGNVRKAGGERLLGIVFVSLFVFPMASALHDPPRTVTHVAGGGGGDGADALEFFLGQPMGMTYGPDGSLYVADYQFDQVVRVTPDGKALLFAGSGVRGYAGDGGLAIEARLSQPHDVAFDAAGNAYVADAGNGAVRRVDAVTGTITTVAGGGEDEPPNLAFWEHRLGVNPRPEIPADAIRFGFPRTLDLGPDGTLYVGDNGLASVWAVDLGKATMRSVAGNGSRLSGGDGGPATAAGFTAIWAIVVDGDGNLYISESYGNKVRRVDAVTGIVTTYAGTGEKGHAGDGGPATSATFGRVGDLGIDAEGRLHIVDSSNHAVRIVYPENGTIDLVFRQLGFWYALAIDDEGRDVVSDNWPRIFRHNPSGPVALDHIAGLMPSEGDGGPAATASFDEVRDAVMDETGDVYIVERAKGWGAIRRVNAEDGTIDLAYNRTHAWDLEVAGPGKIYSADFEQVRYFDLTTTPPTRVNVTADPAFWCPRMLPAPGTLAMDFETCDSRFIALDKTRDRLYISDSALHAILAVDLGTFVIAAFAGTGAIGHSGDGGPASEARLDRPSMIDVLPDGDVVFHDFGSFAIRRVDVETGIITTLAGPVLCQGQACVPVDAGVSGPRDGLPLSLLDTFGTSFRGAGADGSLYLGSGPTLWRVDPENNRLHHVFGMGAIGTSGDGGPAAEATARSFMSVQETPGGGILFADWSAGRVRLID